MLGVWEQQKLSNVASITMGQSPDGSTYSTTPQGHILIQGNADLSHGWVSPRVWTTQVTKTCDAGDIIMSVRAPAGAIGRTQYNAVIGRGVAAIKGNDFIYQSLARMDDIGYWRSLVTGSTFESINSTDLKNAELCVPSLPEQQKIGSFFHHVDDLINLHQRQTQKLTELKQGLLQNMFPREGESVPRLRFPGFTTNWKQQKLGDIYNFHYGEFNNNPDNNGPYPVYGANGIIGGYTKFNAEDSSIIGHIGAAGYVKWGMGKHFVTYNGTIAKPAASSLDSKFGYYALSNKKIYKICAGSGRPFVSYADLNSIDMRIPNDLLEQKKISLLFTRLDDLLALHEQYIVKLTQLKKGLLQKMFPQD